MNKTDNKADTVTIREVYELVDKKVGDATREIGKLRDEVSGLASGRISQIEKDVANQRGQVTLITMFISISVSVTFFIMNLIFNK